MHHHYITVDGKYRSLQKIYIGVDGQPVEIWDKDKGIINEELYQRYLGSQGYCQELYESIVSWEYEKPKWWQFLRYYRWKKRNPLKIRR